MVIACSTLSSARITAYAVQPLVALKGLPDITTHLIGKWRLLSYKIDPNFSIQFLNNLFQFKVLSFLKNTLYN